MNRIKPGCFSFRLWSFVLIICLLTGCSGFPVTPGSSAPKAPAYWPSSSWRSSVPEAQGMDSELLAGMFQQIQDQQLNLHSVLIARNGYIVTEAYFDPYTQTQLQNIYSVTKSVTSTLVGIAIQRGYIKNVDQTVVSFFEKDRPIAALDARKKAITIKDLLTLTAGLSCDDKPNSTGPTMYASKDWVQFMLDAPMSEQPGTKWNYCSGAVHVLSAILQKASGMIARDFANRYLFEPLGIPTVDQNWWPVDPQGITTGFSELHLTPRDLAKIGYLYLQNGQWNDQQIISPAWVKAASTSYITRDSGMGYGYLWTIEAKKGYYMALGYAGQHIYVVPAKNLVIVFTSALPYTEMNSDVYPLQALVDSYILPAVKSEQELPENSAAGLKLNKFISDAAHPKKAVPPLPAGAEQWSGVIYQMEPSIYGWQTLGFDFQPGADTITVLNNGQANDPPVGMDHQFRIQQGGFYPRTANRGEWLNSNTLLVRAIALGELMGWASDIEFRVVFAAEEINITAKYIVSGQEIKIHGTRAAK